MSQVLLGGAGDRGRSPGGQKHLTAFLVVRLSRLSSLQSPCRQSNAGQGFDVNGWRKAISFQNFVAAVWQSSFLRATNAISACKIDLDPISRTSTRGVSFMEVSFVGLEG